MNLPPPVVEILAGTFLGTVVSAVSILGLVGAINFILPPEKRPPKKIQILLLLALLLKVPVLALGAQISLQMGPSGLSALGLSIVSVYSAAVGFLHWRSQREHP